MMIDRIRSKLTGWKAHSLSRAGWLTLIKACITGVPNHMLSCFKCPKEIVTKKYLRRMGFLMLLKRLRIRQLGKPSLVRVRCFKKKFNGLINIKWQPPPLDWIKVNFDGSVLGNLAATGFVICDWNGNVRLVGAKNSGQVSIIVAKCLALRDGLAHATHNGWRKILVEGDSKLIIDCVNNMVSIPWSISILVQDIWVLSSYCEEISFQHIFREANFTADVVASLGHNLAPSRLWDRGLPLSCSVPFYFDLVGPACPRGFQL
ncbi:hypothetical protein L3X38_009896 [Prunus dulcis]|uniref:RNase H type-1 domain-containing protein n=1 Tax=Prunus dulcis TaxID=3755 RepID=A0AAD4ZDW8_PRUDU|nr:hypothetical protein L3X38_009896 [Prunus dulcis]